MTGDFALHSNPIPYITSSLFDSYGIKHLFATKAGGVSAGVFESLNFAAGRDENIDSIENIVKNHDIAASVLGFAAGDICRTRQGHTDNIEIVNNTHKGTGIEKPPFPKDADGLITKDTGVLLSVRSADCVPVLLYDIKTHTAGAVHSGWLGTKKDIAGKAVELFQSLGSDPKDIIAALGPCIKECCYEVGREFYDYFPDHADAFSEREGKIYFSLTAVILENLVKHGILSQNMDICPLCTCCESSLFFSHRRQGNKRGTMAAFIAVKD